MPHVSFKLPEQPSADKVPSYYPPHETASADDPPPPWEPQFETLSPSSLPLRRHPLDPPPRCFSVPSPMRIKSHDFPTFRIPAISDNLTDGFQLLYACNLLEAHGINRADWVRFLEDLGIAARLSSKGLSAIRSRVPDSALTTRRIFPAHALGGVYDKCFARTPLEEVRALMQIWNQCALERRKIRVTLQVRPPETCRKTSYMLVVESL